MKRFISIFVVLSIVAIVFADSVATDESTLKLTLAPEYRLGFIEEGDIGNINNASLELMNEFTLSTTGKAASSTLALNKTANTFYFFYHVYDASNTLTITISADNLKYNTDEIKYNVELTPTGTWDGGAFSPTSFDSGSSSTSTAAIRNTSINSTKYNCTGICQVQVGNATGVNLYDAKPGAYNATISLVLTTT